VEISSILRGLLTERRDLLSNERLLDFLLNSSEEMLEVLGPTHREINFIFVIRHLDLINR
jgi:hypothetical protein